MVTIGPNSHCFALSILIAFLATNLGASAATLSVGRDQIFKSIGQAARAANSGDTILIDADTYADCAVWRADNLTITGVGSGPLFKGVVCQQKAIFVIQGNNTVVRNIKFADAVDEDGNGAGIRLQGSGLVVENVTFTNDQDGILADSKPAGTILVRDSKFDRDGACVVPPACAHGIYAGHIALLRVERTRFNATNIGHSIKSRAARTEIIDNSIEDGPMGTSSYLVDIPNGGTLIMSGNVLEKGPHSDNYATAVSIGAEGKLQASSGILVQGNSFTNDGSPTVFVRNYTSTPAQLVRNVLKGAQSVPLVGSGSVQ